MLILFFILTVAGCTVLYLAQRQQNWLPQALASHTGWTIYLLMQLLAVFCAARVWSALTIVFAWLLISMCSFSLLPFLRLLRPAS